MYAWFTKACLDINVLRIIHCDSGRYVAVANWKPRVQDRHINHSKCIKPMTKSSPANMKL